MPALAESFEPLIIDKGLVTAISDATDRVATANKNVWHGQNWKTKTDLPSVMAGFTILDFSSDGKIAIGVYNEKEQIAIVKGDNYQESVNLDVGLTPTILIGNLSLSADGKVAGGTVTVGDFIDYYFTSDATIWQGENWTQKVNLGTGGVWGISRDGKMAVGWSKQETNIEETNLAPHIATLWSGEQWQSKITLPLLNESYKGSGARDISTDHKIIVGYMNRDKNPIEKAGWGPLRAVVWHGDNWQTIHDLGSLKADNSGISHALATTNTGTVVAGYAERDGYDSVSAVLWSGKNWQTKTDLGSLLADKSWDSIAWKISPDGNVVGGSTIERYYDEEGKLRGGNEYSVLWRVEYNEKNESVTTELPTYDLSQLEVSKKGTSVTTELPTYDLSQLEVSKKGTSVTTELPTYDLSQLEESKKGTSITTELPTYDLSQLEVSKKGTSVTTELPTYDLSQLEVSKKGTSVTTELPVYDTSKIKPPVEVLGVINVDFTVNALQKLGADSIALMAMQQHALSRLQQGCHTDQTFCYDVRADFAKSGETKDTAASFTAGYHFGNGLTLGASFDRSLRRNLPDTYKRNSNNLGWGVFGRWQGENFYVQPAVAWDYYDAQVKRPLYANTETEQHISKIKGLGTSLTLGQDFTLDNKAELGWYLAGRYNRIFRTGYAEKNLLFPVKFGDLSLTDTTVALGTKLALPVSDKLKFLAKAEVEQRVGGKNPTYTAAGQYIGNFRYEGKLNKTRAKFSTGVSYAFSPNFKVEVSPYVERNTFGKTRTGGMLSFNGEF